MPKINILTLTHQKKQINNILTLHLVPKKSFKKTEVELWKSSKHGILTLRLVPKTYLKRKKGLKVSCEKDQNMVYRIQFPINQLFSMVDIS